MSPKNLTRRNFLYAAGAIPGGVALPSLRSLIQHSLGAERIYELLSSHIKLEPTDMPVLREFYQSLLTAEHGEQAEALQAMLRDPLAEDRLSCYLLEEFLTTSSYLARAEGLTKELKFLGIPG